MAFDVRDGLYLPQFGTAILGGMEKGQNLRKGLLEDYVNRKKIEQTNKIEALQNQYLGATDSAEKKDILGKMAVYNPEHAKGIASIATLGMNPFEGTSMEAQKANLQYQRYLAAGYPESEARINAINDAASTSAQYYTDWKGDRVTMGGIPLPDIGGKPVLGGSPRMQQPTLGQIEPSAGMNGMSESEKVVAMLPIDERMGDATPEELSFVKEVVGSKAPAQTYKQGLDAHPELKAVFPEWNDTVAGHFNDIHKAIPKGDAGLPVARAARAQEEAKLGAKDIADIDKEAMDATTSLDNYKQIYDVYKRGFEGGLFSPAKYLKIQAKQAAGQELTPEEQQYSSDYAALKSMADLNVAASIKTTFGGNISDGEREFMQTLQSQPYNMPQQGLWKAATQEAGNLQKIRKGVLKDEWVKHYGAIESKNEQGQSFSQYFAKYVGQNPILTPAFMAQRGVRVPIKKFGSMTADEVFDSLPVGAKYFDTGSDGKLTTFVKKRERNG